MKKNREHRLTAASLLQGDLGLGQIEAHLFQEIKI